MYSDIHRRLKERWASATYTESALRRIEVAGGSGIRRLKDFSIDFNFPVVAIAGMNGSGKSSILACAACAYHSVPGHVPFGIDRRNPHYRFSDFLIHSRADVKPGRIHIRYRHSGAALPPESIMRRGEQWSKYPRRPKRPVQFIGISRAIPASERRKTLVHHFGGERPLRGQIYEGNVLESIKKVLSRSDYQMIGRANSGDHSLHVTRARVPYSGFNMGAGEDSVFEICEMGHRMPRGGLLLIEEAETALHPAAQRALIAELCTLSLQKHLQIVMTTHSEHILRGLPLEGRVLLREFSDGIRAVHGVSEKYALSELSSSAIAELTIFVEDAVSRQMVSRALPFEARRRTRIMEVGSKEALAGQTAAAYRDEDHGPTLTVLDGDTTVDEFSTMFKRNLGKNLDAADIEWLRGSVVPLPGGGPPEQWLLSQREADAFVSAMARLLGSDSQTTKPLLARINPTDCHDIFFEFAEVTGFTPSDILRFWVEAAATADQAFLSPVLVAVDRILANGV